MRGQGTRYHERLMRYYEWYSSRKPGQSRSKQLAADVLGRDVSTIRGYHRELIRRGLIVPEHAPPPSHVMGLILYNLLAAKNARSWADMPLSARNGWQEIAEQFESELAKWRQAPAGRPVTPELRRAMSAGARW